MKLGDSVTLLKSVTSEKLGDPCCPLEICCEKLGDSFFPLQISCEKLGDPVSETF